MEHKKIAICHSETEPLNVGFSNSFILKNLNQYKNSLANINPKKNIPIYQVKFGGVSSMDDDVFCYFQNKELFMQHKNLLIRLSEQSNSKLIINKIDNAEDWLDHPVSELCEFKGLLFYKHDTHNMNWYINNYQTQSHTDSNNH